MAEVWMEKVFTRLGALEKVIGETQGSIQVLMERTAVLTEVPTEKVVDLMIGKRIGRQVKECSKGVQEGNKALMDAKTKFFLGGAGVLTALASALATHYLGS